VYNSSPSGWFDLFSFTDWFKKVFLRHVRHQPGRKLLIGDNLRSHISNEVIDLCKEKDIMFVCLPPNATHLMQPLDVGLFAPMKQAWRKQLTEASNLDPSTKHLSKKEFPSMLRDLIDVLHPREIMPNAFARCGLFPVDATKVTSRIPSIMQTEHIAQHVDAGLMKRLEVRRFGEKKKGGPRGTKFPAGLSYTADREETDDEEEDEVEEDEVEEDEVEEGQDAELEESDEEEDLGQTVEQEEKDEDEELPDLDRGAEQEDMRPSSSWNCDLVVAVYEGQWFVAEVCKEQERIPHGYKNLSYSSIKGTNTFTWPAKKDLWLTREEDIILKSVMVEPVNFRGYFGLKKDDLKKVKSLMVVVFASINIHLHFLLIMPIGFEGNLLNSSLILSFLCQKITNLYFGLSTYYANQTTTIFQVKYASK
jgi:hypothetical protein